MKIGLLWVGKTKSRPLLSLLETYESRIRHFCELRLQEIKPVDESAMLQVVAKEGEKLLARIQPDDYVVALDSQGESLDSEKFTRLVAEKRDQSARNLIFVIGGPYGLSTEVKVRADKLLSLSEMTFTHEMARFILLEQIYRAFTLIQHIPYHK